MALADLLVDLNKQCGTDIELDQFGQCHFVVNEQFSLSLEETLGGRHFYLYGVITNIQQKDEESVFMKALEGNLFGKETGRCSIGYEPTSHRLILFRMFRSMVEFPYFYEEFQKFIAVLKRWNQKCEESAAAEEYQEENLKNLLGQQNINVFIA